VGDHGDVIGRYRRYDALDEKLIDPGLLTSDANFGDDQFFAVLERISQAIPCATGLKRVTPNVRSQAAE
jgi:hypothetical protein